LIRDDDGNLFGTTSRGGIKNSICNRYGGPAGCGVVFELSSTAGGGWTQTVLYKFTGSGGDGISPMAAVVLDETGNLYGTTNGGGTASLGTVFRLSPGSSVGWTESIVHSFGIGYDGSYPESPLIVGSDGQLFGTTLQGGLSNSGTIYAITLSELIQTINAPGFPVCCAYRNEPSRATATSGSRKKAGIH
jgi:uncharacterized repeat protein (TIGR03803 family)